MNAGPVTTEFLANALGPLIGNIRSCAPIAPVACPSHRAVISDCVSITLDDGRPLFLKIRRTDMTADVSPIAAAAAHRAHECGVAPAVVIDSERVLGLSFLPPPWRCAHVSDLQDVQALINVLAAKKKLHASGRIGHSFSPFDRVSALYREAIETRAPLPDQTERLVSLATLIRQAIEASGIDVAFCHNDGVASNVMLGEGVQLVDFDLAGDNDPWFDVGAMINEVCFFDAERRAAADAYAGTYDERLVNRARLYGAIDDLMWGLWGIVRAVTAERAGVEFYKYGSWRLLHARNTVGQREFESWLRRL